MDTERRDDMPEAINMTDLEDNREYTPNGRQRSARTDPSMRDGDSGHGNPYEYDPGDEPGTDADVGDERDVEHSGYAGHSGGAVGGTPAGKRATGGHLPPGEPLVTGSEARGDSTIGSRQRPNGPQPASDEPPIPNYKYLSVPEVLEKVNFLTREQIEQVEQFESRHRKRKTLLTKLTRMLREPSQPRPTRDEDE